MVTSCVWKNRLMFKTLFNFLSEEVSSMFVSGLDEEKGEFIED